MDPIDDFLSGARIAVVGASTDPQKYGHKVLIDLVAHGYDAIPVHPRERSIAGRDCVAGVGDLPAGVHGLSIITPPAVTEAVVQDAIAHGVRRLWLQPGAESERAVETARAAGLTVIAGGPCILVALRTRGRG